MKWYLSIALVGLLACDPTSRHTGEAPPPVASPVRPGATTTATAAASAGPQAPPRETIPLSVASYPWHQDASIAALPATEALGQRFSPPAGFERVEVADQSFGAWLRALPLAAPGTPVRSYEGGVHLPADHRHIAAVSTLDVGARDLQQCADAVMRLHAEWLWHRGRASEASYPSGGGPIPWKRYLAGGYPALNGNSFVWKSRSPRSDEHATYRAYLDVVFSWANTVALATKTKAVERADVRPGDFFVLAGSPGHAVLILDIAERADGRRVALLGQSFMPAQSFQVLRPSRSATWFSLDDDDGVQTPFWPRFPWSSLHRLPE